MATQRKSIEPLGVTVMPEWFQHEGIDAVLDHLQQIGATAVATSPYVMAQCVDGEGGREPPADGDAGKVRPLDRPLWGRHELWVRTAPSFEHDASRYRGLRYQPSPADALTRAEGGWLDRLLDAASTRDIAVYLQVMAASPPGYRVQFSSAVADDACLGPDGRPHAQRVDRNASLASPHVVAYITTLLVELATRYPRVTGFRLDWPEYPPYDFRSALFDFNPDALAEVARGGYDPALLALTVNSWSQQLARTAATSAGRSVAATLDTLLNAGWNDLTAADGPLTPLYDAKRRSTLALLRSCRVALDAVAGPRRRLEAQIFPPPLHRISGFPIDTLDGAVDAIGVKLYTMHWPMLARYWARDLLDGAGAAVEHDILTAAIAYLFGFTDTMDPRGAALRYPEPHVSHPVGRVVQKTKLHEAERLAGGIPVRAFVHSYGPVSDVMARIDLATETRLPLWINRYGYLSDQKLGALRGRVAHNSKW